MPQSIKIKTQDLSYELQAFISGTSQESMKNFMEELDNIIPDLRPTVRERQTDDWYGDLLGC